MTINSTSTKLTKVQKFDMLLTIPEVAENTILVEFITHEKELLAKKNSADRKPTKNQQANEVLADLILDTMELGRLYTISELIKLLPNQENGEPYTQSKISAIVRSMVTVTAKGVHNPDGVIERTEEKGKAYFRKLDLEE